MNKPSLLSRLTEYSKTRIPMHMPGHKRNESLLSDGLPYSIDITEIDGFDNLHDMQGVLKETAELAATLYGARASFPLVGGTTCGILATMHALCPRGSHVLMSRGSHKSVYNGIELLGLHPHYLTAETDENGISGKVDPADVEQMLAHHKVSLVILTSPTYEGVVQDIRTISQVCHKHGTLLFVDSAHGAHLGFSEVFPENAVSCGADVVVMSLHKTMPALTQTALLHICSEQVSLHTIGASLSVFETSSPSYVLLTSIDRCLRFTAEKKDAVFSAYSENLASFYEKTKSLQNLSVLHFDDPGKIILSTKRASLTGTELAERLRIRFHIETEMASAQYILAMTSFCDKVASYDALADALFAMDKEITPATDTKTVPAVPLPKQVFTPLEATNKNGEFVSLATCAGHIAKEAVWAYPPGIPMIVPGEEIPQGFPEAVVQMLQNGVEIKSTSGRIKEQMILTII